MLHPNFNNLAQQFLNYIQYQKRYSQHTFIAYQNDLEQFFIFIQTEFDVTDINQISSSMVRSWLASLKQGNITAKSINRKLSTLKSLYKYLLKQKIINSNPLSIITAPKIPKRLPVFVEEKQMQTLLHHVAEVDTFEQQTQALVIKMFRIYSASRGFMFQITFNQHIFTFRIKKIVVSRIPRIRLIIT